MATNRAQTDSAQTGSVSPSTEQTNGTDASGPKLPSPLRAMYVAMPAGTRGRVLWWGGLAAVAAFGIVDWPVAALVGAGSWVAEQYAKAAQRPAGDREQAS